MTYIVIFSYAFIHSVLATFTLLFIYCLLPLFIKFVQTIISRFRKNVKDYKSKNKVLIIHQIDKQIPLDEIAGSLGISYPALLEEMEHICHAGTKLDINYHLEEVVDVDVEDEIYNYFMDVESDNIEDAMDELGEDYSEEEIKLIHIKFISEVAN